MRPETHQGKVYLFQRLIFISIFPISNHCTSTGQVKEKEIKESNSIFLPSFLFPNQTCSTLSCSNEEEEKEEENCPFLFPPRHDSLFLKTAFPRKEKDFSPFFHSVPFKQIASSLPCLRLSLLFPFPGSSLESCSFFAFRLF